MAKLAKKVRNGRWAELSVHDVSGVMKRCLCVVFMAAVAVMALPSCAEEETVNSHASDGAIYCNTDTGYSNYFPAQNLIVGRTGTGSSWYMYNGIAFFRLPRKTLSAAEWVWPSAQNGSLQRVNADVWLLGWQSSPSIVSSWKHYSDTDDRTLLNGYPVMKLVDDWVPSNTTFSGTWTISGDTPLDCYARLLNRGATTNDYAVIRINPDANFGTAGTDAVQYQFRIASGDKTSPSRAVYTYADISGGPTASPFSDEQRTSADFSDGKVAWAQCATASSVSMPYAAYAGATGGVTRSLVFLVPIPYTTCSNSWFSLNVAPFASRSVPAGVNLDLWGLGVVQGSGDADMALEESVHIASNDDAFTHLGGQTPVKLVDNIIGGGSVLTPGNTIRLRPSAQRAILRWVNNQVIENAETGGSRTAAWLVFRLNPDADVASSDWGVGIGSATTPEIPSRFETIGNVTWKQLLGNTSFESGNNNWDRYANTFTLTSSDFNQARTGSKALLFAVSATEESPITTSANNANCCQDANVSKYRGHRFIVKASFLNPSSNPLATGQSAELRVSENGNSAHLWTDAGILGPSSVKDTWIDYVKTNTFRQTITTARVQPIFRSGTTQGQTSASGSCYCDDVELWVEEFHQIPDEVKGTTIIFR